MSTSAIPDVMDALFDMLSALSSLRGVGIFTAPAGDSITPEAVELGEVEIDETAHSMGGNRQEDVTIRGQVQVVKPGGGERIAVTARDRAFTIFAAVETAVNDGPTILATCIDSNIQKTKLTQGYMPEGRVCTIEFGLAVRAIINP